MCTQYAFFQATLIHIEGCCRNRQKTLKMEIWQNTFSFLCWTLYTFLLKLRTDFLTHPLSSAVFFPACSVSGQPTASPVAALFFTASAAPRGSGVGGRGETKPSDRSLEKATTLELGGRSAVLVGSTSVLKD